ncbi:MAG: hypothetical protein AB198_01220 [Parcubacteria bacterium C7867-003]|nr:MAG: hypothetical protein AB198_01220 [Parcubacteria bacterium C7867-003]
MKKSPQIFWTILFLGIIVLIWVFFSLRNYGGLASNKIETKNSEIEVLPLGEGQTVEKVSPNIKQYKHSILGFSFEYGIDYNISSFGNYFDSTGESILLQKENGEQGLQIVITPFDEDIVLTVKRIKADLPKLSVIDPKEVQMGGERGTFRVTFLSENNLSSEGIYLIQ